MKIHELAQKTGLTAPTIRFYEKEGLLDTPYVQREANNYRDYCQEAVELLLMLKKFQAGGFTLGEFKALIQANRENELPLPKIIELLFPLHSMTGFRRVGILRNNSASRGHV